jgi:hypothetical protein
MKEVSMRSVLLLATTVSLASLVPAQTPPAAAPPSGGPAVTRISYWTTKPGRGAEARAFWKQFAPVFDDMKAKGVLLSWRFVEPALHTGQDWDLAYEWTCADIAAYGRADQYFSAAVAKMDAGKIGADFDAAFDGSKHRDELWRTVDLR